MSRTIITRNGKSYQVLRASDGENPCKLCVFGNYCLDAANGFMPCMIMGEGPYYLVPLKRLNT